MDPESREIELWGLLLKQSFWENMLDVVFEALTLGSRIKARIKEGELSCWVNVPNITAVIQHFLNKSKSWKSTSLKYINVL